MGDHVAENPVRRAWYRFSPKLWAWLASGLTVTGLVFVLDGLATLTGWPISISPDLAAILVAVVSTAAGWLVKDPKLPSLRPREFTSKLVALVVSSGLVTAAIAALGSAGVQLPPYAAAAAAFFLPALTGWAKCDYLANAPQAS